MERHDLTWRIAATLADADQRGATLPTVNIQRVAGGLALTHNGLYPYILLDGDGEVLEYDIAGDGGDAEDVAEMERWIDDRLVEFVETWKGDREHFISDKPFGRIHRAVAHYERGGHEALIDILTDLRLYYGVDAFNEALHVSEGHYGVECVPGRA